MYACEAFEEVRAVTPFWYTARSSLCKQETYSLHQTLAVARNSGHSFNTLVISEVIALREMVL